MPEVIVFIKTALTSHFVGGTAGGMVKGLTMQETREVVATRMVAGGFSSHFISPIVLWWGPRVLELTQEDIVSVEAPAAYFVAFFVGMSGMFIANMTERLIKSKLGVKDD